MSNFCKNCRYSPKEKTGENACPFNFLYWDFLIKHEAKLKSNPRMALIYKHVEKLSPGAKSALTKKVKSFKETINTTPEKDD